MKDVATKQQNAVSTHVENQTEEILSSDILVPFLTQVQGTSESFKQKKAQLGDIIRNTTFEKLGDPEHPIDIVFLHTPKPSWVLRKKPKGKTQFEYVRAFDRTAANETLPWTFWADEDGNEVEENTKGAIEWSRTKDLRVLALLVPDIIAAQKELEKVAKGDLPDPSKALSPVFVSFQKTSYKAGKDVVTFAAQAKDMGVPIWRYQVKLGNFYEQKENSYYVWKVDRSVPKAVPKELLPKVESWVNMIGQIKEAAGDVDDGGEAPTQQPDMKNAKEVC